MATVNNQTLWIVIALLVLWSVLAGSTIFGPLRTFREKVGTIAKGARSMLTRSVKPDDAEGFRTRSSVRDQEHDFVVLGDVASSLDRAVGEVERQRDGLKGRLDDVTSRAAIIGGNDIDDALSREEDLTGVLRASDAEIALGQVRLEALDQQLAHYRFLRAALQSRFPDFRTRIHFSDH